MLSLYEIAEYWSVVSNDDVNRFKDAFHEEFSDAPIAPIGLARDNENIVKDEEVFPNNPSFRIVYPTVRHPYIYTINYLNKFKKFER